MIKITAGNIHEASREVRLLEDLVVGVLNMERAEDGEPSHALVSYLDESRTDIPKETMLVGLCAMRDAIPASLADKGIEVDFGAGEEG